MLIESAYNQLRALTLEGLEAIEQSEFSVAGCKNSIAFFNSKKDELLTNCPSFSIALESVSKISEVIERYGSKEALRLVLQFVALWKLEAELTFRLSFRTSSLLASSDDERLALFSKLTDYYKIRSKIVHGGGLTDVQEAALHEDEPLRKIVRCCLKGFLHLAIHLGEWTLARLEKEADTALMHGQQRMSLRKAMQL